MKILVIEDEPKTVAYLAKGLRENGYVVDHAGDGGLGAHMAVITRYDLIILDVMLPELDGWGVLKELKERRVSTPILYLSARDDVQDRVRGIELGAEDYLVTLCVQRTAGAGNSAPWADSPESDGVSGGRS